LVAHLDDAEEQACAYGRNINTNLAKYHAAGSEAARTEALDSALANCRQLYDLGITVLQHYDYDDAARQLQRLERAGRAGSRSAISIDRAVTKVRDGFRAFGTGVKTRISGFFSKLRDRHNTPPRNDG
jgi:hypothetical protein